VSCFIGTLSIQNLFKVSYRENALVPFFGEGQTPALARQGADVLDWETVFGQLWFKQPFASDKRADNHTF